MKRHLQTHSAAKQFACPFCNKKFKLREYLDVHKRIHDKGSNSNKGSAITLPVEDIDEATRNALNNANVHSDSANGDHKEFGGASGSVFNVDSPVSMTVNQLRQRLVRNSVRYHEDLYLKQERINILATQNNQLKLHLQKCSIALLEAHRVLEQSGQKVPDSILASVMEFSSYRILQTETNYL